ncbi:hypothetical protein ACS0TY_016145 [Phlomoides rotata]
MDRRLVQSPNKKASNNRAILGSYDWFGRNRKYENDAEFRSYTFTGVEASTKKQALLNVVKFAYFELKKCEVADENEEEETWKEEEEEAEEEEDED